MKNMEILQEHIAVDFDKEILDSIVSEFERLQELKEEYARGIDAQWTEYVRKQIYDKIDIKIGDVLELVKDGGTLTGEINKRSTFYGKRFVVYNRNIRMIDKFLLMDIGGWWMYEDDSVFKWSNHTIGLAVSNPMVFKKSKNQSCNEELIKKFNT